VVKEMDPVRLRTENAAGSAAQPAQASR